MLPLDSLQLNEDNADGGILGRNPKKLQNTEAVSLAIFPLIPACDIENNQQRKENHSLKFDGI